MLQSTKRLKSAVLRGKMKAKYHHENVRSFYLFEVARSFSAKNWLALIPEQPMVIVLGSLLQLFW